MLYLVAVSFLWAFSFGLTKGQLAGVDSAFVSAVRLALALLVFLPFLRLRGLAPRTAAALAGIGAVQFGLMYLALNASYRYLGAYEVVLFTVTTPVLVTLLADALDRTLRLRALAAAVIAVAGTAVIVVRAGDLRPALAEQAGGFHDDLRPDARRGARPGPEAALGRSQRVIQLGPPGHGQPPDLLFSGRVQHRQRLARRAPLIVNEKLKRGVIGHGLAHRLPAAINAQWHIECK